MHLSDFEEFIKGEFNLGLSDCCDNGLVFRGKDSINKIGLAVSPTLQIIQEAIDRNVDLLFTHHHLARKGSIDINNRVFLDQIFLLRKSEMSLTVLHLPLDTHNNYSHSASTARELEWIHLENILWNRLPIGAVYELPEIFRADELISLLNQFYGRSPMATHYGNKDPNSFVKRVALVPGRGHQLIMNEIVLKHSVDLFITGTCDESVYTDAYNANLIFLGYGHYSTEVPGLRALSKMLSNEYELDCELLLEDNPF